MAFKMKGFKPHNMYDKQKAETYDEHLALKEKGYKHSPYNKMDPMHNGEPGVQKEDFKQFSAFTKKLNHTNTKCWPGCSPKSGTPKTKISSKTGERVNNCDCNK